MDIEGLMVKQKQLFVSTLEKMKNFQAKLRLKAECKTIFMKARQVSFARHQQVGDSLDKLEADGIIENVTSSELADPIVTPVISYGGLRICGD